MSKILENLNQLEVLETPGEASEYSFNVEKMFNSDSPEKLKSKDIAKYKELNKLFDELCKKYPNDISKFCLVIDNKDNGKLSFLHPYKDGVQSQFPRLPLLICRDKDGNIEEWTLNTAQYEAILKQAEEILGKAENSQDESLILMMEAAEKDENVQKAIANFQKKNNLKVDSTFSEETIKKMEELGISIINFIKTATRAKWYRN